MFFFMSTFSLPVHQPGAVFFYVFGNPPIRKPNGSQPGAVRLYAFAHPPIGTNRAGSPGSGRSASACNTVSKTNPKPQASPGRCHKSHADRKLTPGRRPGKCRAEREALQKPRALSYMTSIYRRPAPGAQKSAPGHVYSIFS